jgi:hypothetical protein
MRKYKICKGKETYWPFSALQIIQLTNFFCIKSSTWLSSTCICIPSRRQKIVLIHKWVIAFQKEARQILHLRIQKKPPNSYFRCWLKRLQIRRLSSWSTHLASCIGSCKSQLKSFVLGILHAWSVVAYNRPKYIKLHCDGIEDGIETWNSARRTDEGVRKAIRGEDFRRR